MPIQLADRMHCTYQEVLAMPYSIVVLYLSLMAAEAEIERKDRRSRRPKKGR